jgi:predicted NBD/HSP70 family sugar kinase
VARTALEETGHYLGIGLASLVNAFNPELIVFGGVLSQAHEFVLPAMRAGISQRALRWSAEAAEIVIAEHGADSCVMGGIASVYYRVLTEPLATARALRPVEPLTPAVPVVA